MVHKENEEGRSNKLNCEIEIVVSVNINKTLCAIHFSQMSIFFSFCPLILYPCSEQVVLSLLPETVIHCS